MERIHYINQFRAEIVADSYEKVAQIEKWCQENISKLDKEVLHCLRIMGKNSFDNNTIASANSFFESDPKQRISQLIDWNIEGFIRKQEEIKEKIRADSISGNPSKGYLGNKASLDEKMIICSEMDLKHFKEKFQDSGLRPVHEILFSKNEKLVFVCMPYADCERY
jgi:hypothetical protein